MNRALRTAAIVVFSCAPLRAQTKPELRAELLKMRDADQAARQAAIGADVKDEAINKRISDVDAADTARMRQIVDEVGWPAASMVGADGASAAWLLVQHADRDVAFQERCLKLMGPLAAAGEASKSDLALLTDRVLVHRHLPQRYGTQTQKVGDAFVPEPMEDPERVDERRASVGLDPMARYLERLKKFYQPAPKSP